MTGSERRPVRTVGETMDDLTNKRILWYTRRDGVVRGPYPDKQISRYILLGRIRDGDEVRPERGEWAPLADYPDLIPEVMKLPPTDENLQKLLMARLREDERRPRDRRDDTADVPADILERRAGVERRRPEPEDMLRHRELRYQVSRKASGNGNLYRYPLAMVALVLAGLLLSFVLSGMRPEELPPECAANARPGINWNGCNLSGLDSRHANLAGAKLRNVRLDAADLSESSLTGVNLEYSILNGGKLRNTDFSHARLVGVSARGADLRGARLNHADLSYANLSDARLDGADLTGADLSNTIWVDHLPCLSGSVGACNRATR
jgi:hypothetical protein